MLRVLKLCCPFAADPLDDWQIIDVIAWNVVRGQEWIIHVVVSAAHRNTGRA
jgi:hypothetical protein